MNNNKEPKKRGKIEIRYNMDPHDGTKKVAMQMQEMFNGPIFAKLVRDAVEEMILEGKLTYDMETDEIDVPEDIVKRWAARMEEEVWSKKD